MLNNDKLDAFFLRLREKQRCSVSPFLVSIVVEFFANLVNQEKEMKGVQMEK